MREFCDPSADILSEFRDDFIRALELAHAVFGQHTFQIEAESGKWRHSQPLFDGIMVALDRLRPTRTTLTRASPQIKRTLKKTLKNRHAYELIVGKPNTAKAVKQRIELIYTLIRRSI